VVSVSKMVVSRAEQLGNYTMEQSKQGIHVNSSDEFFVAASPEFLRSLVEIASAANATSGVAIACLALAELHTRRVKAGQNLLHGVLQGLYVNHPGLQVDVAGRKVFRLAEVVSRL
jgi:hypothetical protein